MREAVIVEAVRTPVGKRNGSLASHHPVELGAIVLGELVSRAQIAPELVDDVIFGVVIQVGEQSLNLARSAVLAAGWPESVPGTTVDRQCGSSQQAIHFAAAGVMSGQYDIVVAGGVENMSRNPLGSNTVGGDPFSEPVHRRYGVDEFNQGLSGEQIASRWGLGRSDVDAFSLASHAKAAAAIDAGRFKAEIVPVQLADGSWFDTDEGVRRGGTLETLGGLRTSFAEDGVLTAGNSSQISDAAAAVLITTPERARELGLTPIVRIKTMALAGDDPVIMLTAPIPATEKVLARAGLRIGDIGVFEVNEAFASVPLAWLAETKADPERLNPNGGAIALGHPLGASGARIMTTLVHHMRDTGTALGLQTMCEGGGLANATILELVG